MLQQWEERTHGFRTAREGSKLLSHLFRKEATHLQVRCEAEWQQGALWVRWRYHAGATCLQVQLKSQAEPRAGRSSWQWASWEIDSP